MSSELDECAALPTTTPLGVPVEPEVYMTYTAEACDGVWSQLGDTPAAGRSWPAAGTMPTPLPGSKAIEDKHSKRVRRLT